MILLSGRAQPAPDGKPLGWSPLHSGDRNTKTFGTPLHALFFLARFCYFDPPFSFLSPTYHLGTCLVLSPVKDSTQRGGTEQRGDSLAAATGQLPDSSCSGAPTAAPPSQLARTSDPGAAAAAVAVVVVVVVVVVAKAGANLR